MNHFQGLSNIVSLFLLKVSGSDTVALSCKNIYFLDDATVNYVYLAYIIDCDIGNFMKNLPNNSLNSICFIDCF